MKLKSTLAALALAVSGASAFAADTTIAWNPTFSIGNFFGNYSTGDAVDERFGFTVHAPSYVTASLISNDLDTFSNFDFTSVSLNGNNFTNLGNNTSVSGTEVESWALGRTRLDPGTYYLTVNGTVDGTNGGAFSGMINVSPVPEPETYALMLAGLGVVGFLARRRQKS
ncbi:FxDxF family PEP-CTERM protein [Caldimonas tepidiphila]|uniref:FxDxF family PEP-CTERM protein n=1 Tax=Caldimonas tepidiphila TaxID=2315841 RepID=UPI001300AA3A|nr:FxDxF family PEP-CTERM protein [Caldimonas tepidiphila]